MSVTALHDIETSADCERLVRSFYGRAMTDPIIGFIFTDVARLDLEAHVPVIASFWATVLLGERSYAGGAFRPHADLNAKVPLQRGHFERWLVLWRESVDELFAGARAEEAKGHALRVATAFYNRLQGISADPTLTGPPDGGLVVITQHGPAGGRTGVSSAG